MGTWTLRVITSTLSRPALLPRNHSRDLLQELQQLRENLEVNGIVEGPLELEGAWGL